MTWYEDNFKRRMPIAIDTSSVSSGVAIQFQITIPTYWDDFWDNVRSDGFDVHLVDQNGNILTFERLSGWNVSTRTGQFRANHGTSKASNVIHTAFIYYDASDESTDSSSSVPSATPLNAYVYLGSPFGNIVSLQDKSNLSTTPVSVFQKDPDEIVDIWYPIAQLLAPSQLPINKRLSFLFVEYIDMEILNSSGVDQVSMYGVSTIRIINNWIKVRVQSGASDTDYVVRLIINDTNNQKFILSSLLQIRKLLPE